MDSVHVEILDSFHIWHQWSLALEGVSCSDLDLYLQGCLAVMLPISCIILMWHKYNPWRDDVSHIISQSIGQRSRSHRPFKFLQSSILLDYWSAISSYCWRKVGFRPSMNVSWDFCRWHCWGIHCWSCIYCLNVPCYKRYNLIKRNYLLYLKNLTLKRSHSGSNFL